MAEQRRSSLWFASQTGQGVADMARLANDDPYRTLFAAFPVIIFTTDVNGVVTLSEGRGLEALGLRPGELVGVSIFDAFGGLTHSLTALRTALGGEPASSVDIAYGRTLETRFTPIRDQQGAVTGVAALSFDITERVETEHRLLRANRLYDVLSHVGETVVRLNDRQQLFNAVCRIAVEYGGFRLAWIALLDPAAQSIMTVAYDGVAAAYLAKLRPHISDDDVVLTRALRDRQPMVSNDLRRDFPTSPWLDHAEQQELRSTAAFPLVVHGAVIGALSLYASVAGFFDEQELGLCNRVAQVLAFALEKLEEERQRALTEQTRRLDIERQDALLRLSEMTSANEREIVQYALEEAVRLTHSRIGYLHFINEDQQSLRLFTWSNGVREECYAEETTHYPLEQAGVWVDCVRQRRPVFHNDYPSLPNRRGYPAGHIHLERHLSVPLIDRDMVVAVTGVGNKIEPYDEHDARQLLLFMNGMWVVLQRKRAETALRESESRYRRITDHALDIVYRYRTHPELQCEYVSPSVTTITGYTPEEHYADPYLSIKMVHPDDQEGLVSLVQGDGLYGGPIELRWVRRDGDVLWVEQRNVPVYNDDGAIIALEGIARDITKRKHAEEALLRERALLETRVAERTREAQEERDRTRAILEALGEAVMVIDLDDQIQYANPAATRLTGIEAGAPPLSWYEWTRRQIDAVEPLARMRAAIETGETWKESLVLVRPDGTAYDAEMSAAPLFSPHDPGQLIGFVSVHHDITAMKTAERMKDQFVSNVSHELRSPISLITMLAGSLEMLYPRLEDQRRLEVIGDIRKHARNLSDLIGGVLEISRIDGGRIAHDRVLFNLAQLAVEEVEALAPTAQRKHLAITIVAPAELMVAGQIGQMRQVIRNLITNAIKYTPDGGQIACTVASLTIDGAALAPRAEQWPGFARLPQGAWGAFRIRDTGIGINQADLPHVFERFFRAENQTDIPGTGLGLSIAWELVRLHGGHIDVQSAQGAGSTFAVYLPISQETT